MNQIHIQHKTVGSEQPCFIIAEGGLNHNGDPLLAEKMVSMAALSGADAIKFQTYTPEELFSAEHPDYKKFQQHVFSRGVYEQLQTMADEYNIILLSTPFDEQSADLLESLFVPVFKIGSGELTHLEFLKYIARKQKPMIVSCGMSTWEQVDRAVETIRENGDPPLVLLHCISAYPCPLDEANIKRMTALQERYRLPVGYSDHTQTDIAAIAAVALGACVIEKHFTLSRHLPGWDHFFSYDPDQFKRFVNAIRNTETALGSPQKDLTESEIPIQELARRAIYARTAIQAGEIIQKEHVIIRRPLGPLEANQIDQVVGKRAARDISGGESLRLSDLEP